MRTVFVLAWLLIAAIAFGENQAEIVSFRASARTIRARQSVTLTWQTRGVHTVSLDWAPSTNSRGQWQHRTGLPPTGSLAMTPVESSVYILTCESGTGSKCPSASVRVVIKP
jgi:hypothetical protein